MQGSLRQRSPGSWEIRYDGPPVVPGKRNYVTETVRGTRKQAERILAEKLAAVSQGTYVAKRRETVAEFLVRWMETYAATNTSPRTQQGYWAVINKNILPYIGHIRLQQLQPRNVQNMYAALVERGLSNLSVRHAHRILHKALADALKWGDVERNVTDATTPPRVELKELEVWDRDTIRQFFKVAKDSLYYGLYILAILSGMRRSEILGLKWQNVDLTNGTVRIVSTLQRITGKGLVEGTPKTPRSRRQLPLHPMAVGVLTVIRDRQNRQRETAGEFWEETGYVFTNGNGRPIDSDLVSHDFIRIVRKADLPRITFHGLRHSYATLLLAGKVHPKVAQELLGHASVSTTLDIYSHVLPGIREDAITVLDGVVEPVSKMPPK